MESFQTPSYRVEVVQPDKDGRLLFNKVWYLFMQQIAAKAGGTVTNNSEDFSPSPEAAAANLEVMLATFAQGLDQRPQADVYSGLSVDDLSAALSRAFDEIGELRKELNSLKQGTLTL